MRCNPIGQRGDRTVADSSIGFQARMIRVLNETSPPASLAAYLDENPQDHRLALRRRSVLIQSAEEQWVLAISVVHAFPNSALCPLPTVSHRYKELLLLEDWLDCSEARFFVDAVQAGMITLDGKELTRATAATWHSEFVSSPNPFMDRIGLVVQTRFETRQIALAEEPLFTATEPYYPNAAGALQDWTNSFSITATATRETEISHSCCPKRVRSSPKPSPITAFCV